MKFTWSLFIMWAFLYSISANSNLLCNELGARLGSSKKAAAQSIQLNDASTTRSQLIRDNFKDWVEFSRAYLPSVLESLPQALRAPIQNLVAIKALNSGENHAGNYVISADQNGQLRYYMADIKDGGYGSAVYHIANLVMNTAAVAKRGNKHRSEEEQVKVAAITEALMNAYRLGLEAKPMEVPSSVRIALQTKPETLAAMKTEDTLRFVSKKSLELGKTPKFKEKSKLIPFRKIDDAHINKAALKKIITAALTSKMRIEEQQILDFAIRLKDRGGGKSLKRFWVLIKNSSGDLQIVELKEHRLSNTELAELLAAYNPSVLDPSNLLAEIDGATYEIRERKIELLSVPYKQSNPGDYALLMELAGYAAYHSGLMHAELMPAESYSKYLKLISENSGGVYNFVREMAKAYLKRISSIRYESEEALEETEAKADKDNSDD